MAQLTNNTDFSVLKYNNNSSNNINKVPINKEILQENNIEEINMSKMAMVPQTDTNTGNTELSPLQFDYPSDLDLWYSNIYNDGYTPQGITYADDKVIISAYDNGHYSRLYVYDLKNHEDYYKVELPYKAHAGGCSYDEKDKVLFVTDKDGAVAAFSFTLMNEKADISKNGNNNEIVTVDLNNETNKSIKLESNININDGDEIINQRASSVYYDNKTNQLYIVRYSSTDEHAYVVVGTLNYDKNSNTCTLDNQNSAKLDRGMQDVATYRDRSGKTYLVESRSWGTQSVITVRDITDGIDKSKVIGSKSISGFGSEGIEVNNAGIATIVYESPPEFAVELHTRSVDINEIIKENNGEVYFLWQLDRFAKDKYK